MKHTETAAEYADEAFAAFAQVLSNVAQHWGEGEVEQQLAELRKILVESAQLREQAFAGLIDAWRDLADLGSAFAAPIAAFHGGDAARARELEAHATELQHACDALAALLAPLPAEAFTRFAAIARTRLSGSKPFESVKAVYDAWIESSEAAYARLAHTEEFASTQSRLNQASLRLRGAQVALIESAARHLGLPTRAEVDNLHQQLYELRKEIATLRGAAPSRDSRGPKAQPRRKRAQRRKRAPARRR